MARIAITCTAPRCTDIVTDLIERGYDAYACPALEVTALAHHRPSGDFDGMLLTSRHAIIEDLPRHLPVIAVGAQTASLARTCGHTVVQVGDNCLSSLDLSLYRCLLYPCALEPTDIPLRAKAWPVYKTRPVLSFDLDEDTQVIAVFSAKAAEVIAPHIRPHHHVVCLSAMIGERFQAAKPATLAVCTQPDYDEMTQLIIEVWNNECA